MEVLSNTFSRESSPPTHLAGHHGEGLGELKSMVPSMSESIFLSSSFLTSKPRERMALERWLPICTMCWGLPQLRLLGWPAVL